LDDILTTFVQNETSVDTIHNIIKNTDRHLEFKISREGNKPIIYLDTAKGTLILWN